ncbi:7177_t:CDS:10 [Paraglomus occultum]|uniref:7177_t:CDS:1 n=1 Tax=Paraglomus occultum TaxID=144539 RepID=A0A9N8VYM5_9GLOM|nr:7177_t:CDS:10 [Paraglomus occultum]
MFHVFEPEYRILLVLPSLSQSHNSHMNTPPATPPSLESLSSFSKDFDSSSPETILETPVLSSCNGSKEENNHTDQAIIDEHDNRVPKQIDSIKQGGNDPTKDDSNKFDPVDSVAEVSREDISQGQSNKSTLSTLWVLFKEEITASDSEHGHDAIAERLMVFGLTVCLDSFLYTLTILPLRFVIAFYALIMNIWDNVKCGIRKRSLNLSQTRDLLKGLLIVLACIALQRIDASRMYHSIRGQAAIKLYVIFNVLEILDRLFCSFGGDILDSLFAKSTLCSDHRAASTKQRLRPAMFFGIAFIYISAHTIILFYQVITLNVAINSYSNALLTLLLSNQFIEIKGSVFKRFEKENLFQLSCADIVERFQLSMFLTIITVRNLVELTGSPQSTFSILPASFIPLFPFMSRLETLLTPVVIVMVSELIVDWLKHAFITKFNQIRPSVYSKYIDILCRDLVLGSPRTHSDTNAAIMKQKPPIDQSSILSRRIGFAALPLACLLVRMTIQTFSMISELSADMEDANCDTSLLTKVAQSGFARPLLLIALFLIIVLLKIMVGVYLMDYAKRRYTTMEKRMENEQLKQVDADKEVKRFRANFFDNPEDNVYGKEKPEVTLDNIERYTLFKSRIP